ncbi:hypothetical protein MPTK1_4g20240 [Marchantia polymorpha subsp. ruderalis]|uniref:Uncharacterized protein n=2 Tax=Marchantia polymorpha TaxID=3197 RepID=A0AAF6BBW7_MARPO|nr:hypothetical protein MARPO_0116s0026 [Marchantia polymorpha]BBN09501.1 hypothetical protein Mp_4g20240 [Marchantia polymorpha subsp. ruderalis]|eukprot:PTQ31037.1 hypothetical protein MARPO_0116s0026 [Marchantia polymorpha]
MEFIRRIALSFTNLAASLCDRKNVWLVGFASNVETNQSKHWSHVSSPRASGKETMQPSRATRCLTISHLRTMQR